MFRARGISHEDSRGIIYYPVQWSHFVFEGGVNETVASLNKSACV